MHEGWLGKLGATGTAVLTLLALAADEQGMSYYGRDRMARALGMTQGQIDEGLERLLAQELVVHRPWQPGRRDGVWQLLPIPKPASPARRDEGPTEIGALIARLRAQTNPPN